MSLRKTALSGGRKGQSLVETALVLPIILVILTAIFDFGLVFNNYLIVSNASREGARYAAVGYTDAEIGELVENITGTLDQTKLTTTIVPAQVLRKKGEEVTVTVMYDNRLLTPVISAILPNPLQLEGKTVMRME